LVRAFETRARPVNALGQMGVCFIRKYIRKTRILEEYGTTKLCRRSPITLLKEIDIFSRSGSPVMREEAANTTQRP
jgi:hypothetical protein